MVEIAGLGGGVVPFPAVFFDGEREIEIGNVAVYPGLDFKRLQTLLSQRIGLAPHQFSVHLASPDSARKIPISAKSNLAAVARYRGWLFIVVLKRSRAHHHSRKNGAAAKAKNPPENVMLLRRDRAEDSDALVESFLRDLVCAGGSDPNLTPSRVDIAPLLVNYAAKKKVACEDCLRAKASGRVAEFHHCVNDEIVYGLRTPAGPIARLTRAPTESGSGF